MRKIYSCIDIGSHSLKLAVVEKIDNDFVILSRAIVKSKGIKKGEIVDLESVEEKVKVIISKIEHDLKIKIKEILCLVPSITAKYEVATGEIEVDGEIDGNTIEKLMNSFSSNLLDDSRFVLSRTPVSYNVDGVDNIKDVKNMDASFLKAKAVLTTVSKKTIASYVELFKNLGIRVIDVGFSVMGDYYNVKHKEIDMTASAIVNIGFDKIDVGIFNKGILIKSETIDFGSKYIDIDICNQYNVDRKTARYLKENFACGNTRYAMVDDVVVVNDRNKNKISINQLKISEIIESRLVEILKIAKKQISILTKREIRYIIVTGGISELAGFEYVLENVFGRCATVLNMNKMGVRSNSFSSCVGFCIYFDEILSRYDKAYSMINDTELDLVMKRTRKTSSEGGLGGLIGYFTGNKED